MSMFEYATRNRLRFNYKGQLTVEDLWQLPLSQLNEVAKGLNRQIKEEVEESFIEEKTSASKHLEVAFDIVKHIIGIKMDEKKAVKDASDRKAQREVILEILRKKQQSNLEDMSSEDLEKKLAKLS